MSGKAAAGGLQELCFKYTEWLQHFELNAESALAYFKHSPFYDWTCNNEQLHMQSAYSGALSPEAMDAKLKEMTGIEFAVGTVAPPVVLIHKQKRVSPTKVEPLATYYILDGTVYQAPSLQRVFNARLMMSLFHLEAALSEVYSSVVFDPVRGYQWKGGAAEPAVAAADHIRTLQARGNVEAVLQQLAEQPTEAPAQPEPQLPRASDLLKKEAGRPQAPTSRTSSPAPTAAAIAGAELQRSLTPLSVGSPAATKRKKKGALDTPPLKKGRSTSSIGTPPPSAKR